MTTQTTQELAAQVAEGLGWESANSEHHPWIEYGDGRKECDLHHYSPSDPRELLDLMVRFDVWPQHYDDGDTKFVVWYFRSAQIRENYTDHASKLETATRVILRGVLLKIEGEKK